MELLTILTEQMRICSGEEVTLIPLTSPETLNRILSEIKDPEGKWNTCTYSEKKFLTFECPSLVPTEIQKHFRIIFVDQGNSYSGFEYLNFCPSDLTGKGDWKRSSGLDAQLLHELLCYKREMKNSFKKNFYLAVIPNEK